MKAYYFLLLFSFLGFTPNIYAVTTGTESENVTQVRYSDILENGFPEMEIQTYELGFGYDGPFYCNTNYRFIVQPKVSVPGFDSKRFDFAWFLPGGVTSSVKLEGCGIQVATFIANVSTPGRYTLTVQLWDGAGHTTVVERELVFE